MSSNGHTKQPDTDSALAEFDRQMMAIALTMARRGLGATAPNPSVGAVIARPETGEVLARATTAPGGRPHAEPQAIEMAGAASKGASIYVTLEPCSHHGRTGPCADAIIEAGLQRAVIGLTDPDPRVAGRGLERIREAGIEVVRAGDRQAIAWATIGHILSVTERRPVVCLKLALDRDGSVARGDGASPRWVTGEQARARGHLLRAQSDAIMVGAGTVRDDNPMLDCRLPGLERRSPVRVVLSNDLDLPMDCRLIASARDIPLWLMTTSNAPEARRREAEAAGATVITVAAVANRIWLPSVMEALAARGMTRLMVEGGPTLWRAFGDAGLVDEVALFKATCGADLASDRSRVDEIIRQRFPGLTLELKEQLEMQSDRLWRYRRLSSEKGT